MPRKTPPLSHSRLLRQYRQDQFVRPSVGTLPSASDAETDTALVACRPSDETPRRTRCGTGQLPAPKWSASKATRDCRESQRGPEQCPDHSSREASRSLGFRQAFRGAVRRLRTSLRYPYPIFGSGGQKAASLGESGGAVELVVVAALEVALRRKVVVDRGVDRSKLL